MRNARVVTMAALVAVAGCGGGGSDGGGTTGPAVFTTLSVAPSSAALAVNETQTLTPTAKDQNGASMSGLTVTYASDNQAVATVTQAGVVTAVSVGSARITATGTVGTVTKSADVTISVANAKVTATTSNTFEPKTVTIPRGGSVAWTFATLHNVTFDTQGAPAGIGDKSGGAASVTFPTAGTYQYHCTIHGLAMNGTVVVQ